jgi:hypothetical protein
MGAFSPKDRLNVAEAVGHNNQRLALTMSVLPGVLKAEKEAEVGEAVEQGSRNKHHLKADRQLTATTYPRRVQAAVSADPVTKATSFC